MSSETSNAADAIRGGGRAFGSGPRWVVAAAAAGAVAVAVVLVLMLSGSSSSVYAYHKGQLPAWIPNATAPANPGPVVATLNNPASTLVEGDTVHAVFAQGMAMVNVSGPVEPESVQQAIMKGKSGTHSPGTFTVTFRDVHGVVPVAAGDFLAMVPGHSKLPPSKVWVRGGGKVPGTVREGENLTLIVHFDSLPEGEGALAWTPEANKLLAGWDFDFELT